ncbi:MULTISPECIES: aminotransferase class V-fold PLP-dependent enzyme [unclassified Leeuwenhoekiella]|uniref:aminotransferase class V-fold PLP-dependent enzyme n=1 Tax=unclassified Leeuwenhoekiella TaxID=2615029 RepID=UPI000C46647F|nr:MULTISPECIES: aminotransferase class V-fold PLP-dependent enzyme [unclassified Leeuwenhoekiella]MAW94046.1 pyridoxal phosphate-dependent aminotransferase [Leeuwenhoekiella sp.]MBA80915.1 pyridoxal phosphate-dependent aminotransferase [Leeuwenhoekiella sp.]|tara:strand:+ start:34555 stop:35694 length:1140 start_codon:yes stop_codon:yes gene_type:complete
MGKASKIGLSIPLIDERDTAAVTEALQANWITAGGPFVGTFEQHLRDCLNTKSEVVALNTGTAALHLSLLLADVKPGDFVICQTMSYVATANPIAYLNAIPVFVDSEAETFNLNPDALREAIQFCLSQNKKPAAIFTVHSYGIPCKLDEIAAIARQYEIPLIEDAAEALGSTYKGQACGTFGDFGILSFNGNKIITTGGGGALICKDATKAKQARHLASQAKIGQEGFDHDSIGYNYAMPGLNAALGISQLKSLEARISAKRNLHGLYTEIFENLPDVELVNETTDTFANYWLSVLRFTNPASRFTPAGLMQHFKDAGIESRQPWKPLHLQGIYEQQHYFGDKAAETLWRNGLCLPSGCGLTKTELKHIRETLIAYFST